MFPSLEFSLEVKATQLQISINLSEMHQSNFTLLWIINGDC